MSLELVAGLRAYVPCHVPHSTNTKCFTVRSNRHLYWEQVCAWVNLHRGPNVMAHVVRQHWYCNKGRSVQQVASGTITCLCQAISETRVFPEKRSNGEKYATHSRTHLLWPSFLFFNHISSRQHTVIFINFHLPHSNPPMTVRVGRLWCVERKSSPDCHRTASRLRRHCSSHPPPPHNWAVVQNLEWVARYCS